MNTDRAVLVTGANSGIGRRITEHLAAQGVFVYAGCRREPELRELSGLQNVKGVRLDVTRSQDIASAVNLIKQEGRGLCGLVNNAGVGSTGAVLETPETEMELVTAVNVQGPCRVTQAFVPLLMAQKGRIVNIGSIMGILAPANLSLYCMSKHAMEAFTDSLAAEMDPLGLHVSIIEPGNYQSQLASRTLQRQGLDSSTIQNVNAKEPEDVAVAAAHALLDPWPKRRYLVVSERSEALGTLKKQVERLVQLNEGHQYTLERDALVKMLDEALAHVRSPVLQHGGTFRPITASP